MSDGDDPDLAQAEIDQTIVARAVPATLQSLAETREYPTRQAEMATRQVLEATYVPQTRQALSAKQTRMVQEATRAARNAPAPYSVKVQNVEVICREIAYEYLYTADLGKIVALQHVANTISIRSNSAAAYISAATLKTLWQNASASRPRIASRPID